MGKLNYRYEDARHQNNDSLASLANLIWEAQPRLPHGVSPNGISYQGVLATVTQNLTVLPRQMTGTGLCVFRPRSLQAS